MRSIVLVIAAGAVAVTGLVAPARATFGGSNGRLLYQEKVGDYEQLFSAKPDGSGARQLTDFSDSDAVNASWSPDGKKIVFGLFTQTKPGTEREGIYTANADGSNVQRVTNSPTRDAAPDWRPHPLAT